MLNQPLRAVYGAVDRYHSRFQTYVSLRVIPFLCKRDTAIIEGILAAIAICFAWQVLDSPAKDGRVVAPFLTTAIKLLLLPKTLWVVVLAGMGFVKIVCMVHGLAHDNFYRIRSYAAMGASNVWALLAVTIWFSDNPRSVAALYLIFWSGSMSTYVILLVRHRHAARLNAAREQELIERLKLASQLALPRCSTIDGEVGIGT